MEQRRRAPRFPFSAHADVLNNGTAQSTRVTDLSLYGCYLESACGLSPGAHITVKITADSQFFEAGATVVFSEPNSGIGVMFRDVKPVFLPILQKWLRQALDMQIAAPAADVGCDSNQK